MKLEENFIFGQIKTNHLSKISINFWLKLLIDACVGRKLGVHSIKICLHSQVQTTIKTVLNINNLQVGCFNWIEVWTNKLFARLVLLKNHYFWFGQFLWKNNIKKICRNIYLQRGNSKSILTPSLNGFLKSKSIKKQKTYFCENLSYFVMAKTAFKNKEFDIILR